MPFSGGCLFGLHPKAAFTRHTTHTVRNVPDWLVLEKVHQPLAVPDW
jgi:hypothetical protein